ncbi:MAG: gamma-glutamyltransferase, partial [Dongiaceae bacterium]
GDYQDQWSLVFFLRHVHHGMNLQQAIDAPMFQTDHLVGSFWPRGATLKSLGIEDRVDPKTVAALGKRGHDVTLEQPWSLGRISAASRRDGVLKAAANPRGMQGYAIGR